MGKITIDLRNDFISSLFLFFLCIPTLALSEGIKSVLYLIWIVSFFWSLFTFFIYRIYLERNLYPIFCWILVVLLSSILNPVDFVSNLRLIILIFSSTILTYNLLLRGGRIALRSIGLFYFVLTLIQIISVITHCFGYSNDIYVNRFMYFFGLRVNFTPFFVFSLAVSILLIYYGETKDRMIGLIIIGIGVWFVIYENVSTCIMAGLIFLFSIVATRIDFKERLWKFMGVMVSIISLYLVFNYQMFEKFAMILVTFLGKDISLSGRTQIWQQAMDRMHGWHWIIGNGYGSGYNYRLGTALNGRFVESVHNQYLENLTDFGIVGSVFFFLIFFVVLKSISWVTYQEIFSKRIVTGALLALIVMGIASSYTFVPYFYMFVVVSLYFEGFDYETTELEMKRTA